ncbi:ATP-binding protein [Rhizobium sp. SSA_523]|uniref:ATP-binding protein n=1 Tax=Rhizobium sp. SSA_523 TaxID=2952477 RepID=UPI0020900FEE|nr:HAMP domain-containing sensor histidine kinase [Rhizobium sp. SSA_523]MCO5732598.1 HAMP domain-containing histidine kinase [Rhizobium sp. SSA_523]WKC25808.1 HAMP domain-containing sensor histidine kinase [Rhizobium sp. SSA_523]
MPQRLRGLSGRLLWLTVIFVMFAEVLIFVPSISVMRMTWLRDRLDTAAAAGIVIDGLQPAELPRAVQDDTLLATGTKLLALKKDGTSRLLAAIDVPPQVDQQIDLANETAFGSMRNALDTLVFGGGRVMRVFGPIGETDMVIELVMPDDALRKAMIGFSKMMFGISLLISLVTAGLIYIAINKMMIGPLRRLTHGMQSFSEQPEDPERIFAPGHARGELEVAGAHLAAMQMELQRTLKQKKNLADLGLAVSKINHDMRNILASAQLMSDRLVDVDDPMVRSFAPKLLRTIDRAVGYTNEVLAYGQADEAMPRRRLLPLAGLCREVRDMLAIDPEGDIDFVDQVSEDIEVDADSEQLFRVIHNLCRNALQALGQASPPEDGSGKRLSLTAQRVGSVVSITIDDNGPGMPRKARENLFTAFRGSARSGGTGLGLAIARELILAHGGTIALVEKPGPGTQFRIEIPDRPVSLEDYRARA